MFLRVTIAALTLQTFAFAQGRTLSAEDADARLRRAAMAAREASDAIVLERVLEIRDQVERSLGRGDQSAVERLVRDAESVAELDFGGKTMFGLPVAQTSPRLRKAMAVPEAKLADALARGDRTAIEKAIGELSKLLGDSAGVPEVRRRGDKLKPEAIAPQAVAEMFLKAIADDPRRRKALSAGVPAKGTMPRAYASVVEGCVAIRPLVEKHVPAKLAELDALATGCAKSLVAMQTEAGYFRFPDTRLKTFEYGEMIDRLIEANPAAVQGEWVIVPLPNGESQTDAAECGIALLRAGKAYRNDEWTKAGMRAADWAASIPPVAGFHLNACSVSLLCEAFRANNDKKYLDAAQAKFQLGVEPGQTPTGRWLDPRAARTTNHLILLRAVLDLEESTPAGPARESLGKIAIKAMSALAAESESLGVPSTPNTIQELGQFVRLHPDALPKARDMLEVAATGAVRRCTTGDRIRAAVPLPELASVARVWEK